VRSRLSAEPMPPSCRSVGREQLLYSAVEPRFPPHVAMQHGRQTGRRSDSGNRASRLSGECPLQQPDRPQPTFRYQPNSGHRSCPAECQCWVEGDGRASGDLYCASGYSYPGAPLPRPSLMWAAEPLRQALGLDRWPAHDKRESRTPVIERHPGGLSNRSHGPTFQLCHDRPLSTPPEAPQEARTTAGRDRGAPRRPPHPAWACGAAAGGRS
jgi:hypothetical protein